MSGETNSTFFLQANKVNKGTQIDANSVEFLNGTAPNLTTNPKRIWVDQLTETVKYTVDGVDIHNVDGIDTGLVNVKSYNAKGDGVTNDTAAIQAAINANSGKTIFFPGGVYLINAPLTIISNECSLLLSSGAEIRANAAMSAMLTYNTSFTQSFKRSISGGVWNGNGLANICLNLIGFAGLTVESTLIKNPLLKGIYASSDGIVTGSSFELLCHDVHMVNTLSFATNPNVIGIHHATSDCTYDSIRMKDFTVGMLVTSAGNFFNDWHGWISQTSTRLATSIGVDNQALANNYTNFFFDTWFHFYKTDHEAHIESSIWSISEASRSLLGSNPAFINATSATAVTYISDSSFLFTGAIVGQNVDFAIGNPTTVKVSSSEYSQPNTNITNKLMSKVMRIRLNGNALLSVPANSFRTYQFVITDPLINFGLGDSVVFNTRAHWENGLIANYAVTGTNTVQIKLYNVTAALIAPVDRVLYATVIPNAVEILPSAVLTQS